MILVYIILCLVCPLVKGNKCEVIERNISCASLDLEEFQYVYRKTIMKTLRTNVSKKPYSIEIFDSNFQYMKYFYIDMHNLTKLTIQRSLPDFDNDLFEGFQDLQILDLSWNNINRLNFTLPTNLKILKLTGNNFSILPQGLVCTNLIELDLSYCRISSIVANSFRRVEQLQILKLQHNSIQTLNNSLSMLFSLKKLDVSYNNIKRLSVNDIPGLAIDKDVSVFLDFSFNDIESIRFENYEFLYTEYLHISLNASNNFKISDIFIDIQLEYLDLSSSKLDISNVLKGNQVKVNSLILSDNNVNRLNQSILKLDMEGLPDLQLSNCSVQEIEKNYFASLRFKTLNISYNNIGQILNSTFARSRINYLDLSFSNISHIADDAFEGLNCIKLILRGNNLHSVNSKLFNSIEDLRELDLSLNEIKTLQANFLSRLYQLTVVNISSSNIEFIHKRAFVNLTELWMLDLSNNSKLKALHWKVFEPLVKLNHLYLYGNEILRIDPFTYKTISINTLENLLISFNENSTKDLHLIVNPIQTKNLFIIDSSFDLVKDMFIQMNNLENLYLYQTKVNKLEAGGLKGLFSLQYADFKVIFKNVKIITKGFFNDLFSLVKMDLSNIELKELEPGAFTGLLSLEVLRLDGNFIPTLSNKLFEGLDKLRELNLSSSQISSLESETFFGLSELRRLNLEYNNISMLPVGFLKYCVSLTELKLKNNMLKFIEIGVFTNLKDLNVLDLSRNQLYALDYKALISLQNLRVLKLYENHLIKIDFNFLVKFLGKIDILDVGANKWKCDYLSTMILRFKMEGIRYLPEEPHFDRDNIDGISCVDICKFLSCSNVYEEE